MENIGENQRIIFDGNFIISKKYYIFAMFN